MGDDYEQATPEQKLAIANYFLMSSPTGEVHEVLTDVSKLVGDQTVLTDAKITEMMKNYNVEQMQPAKSPDGNMLVVSPHGQVADDEFLDPSTGKVLKFDHRNHKFPEETDKKQSLSDDVNSYRKAVEDEMAKYMDNQYKKGKCVITVYGADDGAITVCLSARNTHLSAFWTGGWRSKFTFNCKSKSKELSMSCKINVHYFEDGNVQLHAAIDKSEPISVTDPAGTAASVSKAINKLESEFQSNMEEMYVEMHRSTFKAMRRFLPISKQPMKWNQYAHAIAKGK